MFLFCLSLTILEKCIHNPYLRADPFWHICSRQVLKNIVAKGAIIAHVSLFDTMLLTQFNYLSYIYRDFPFLCLHVFIVVFWKLLYVGNSFKPFPHIDTFWHLCSSTTFETIVTKGKNCLFWAISPFVTMVSSFCSNYIFIYRHFLGSCQHAFKIVCCRFDVCGKGFKYVI